MKHKKNEKKLNIASLRIGESAEIRSVNCVGTLGLRFYEMGLTPGTRIVVVRRAPFGDPVEICFRGYCLSLRRCDSEQIEVMI